MKTIQNYFFGVVCVMGCVFACDDIRVEPDPSIDGNGDVSTDTDSNSDSDTNSNLPSETDVGTDDAPAIDIWDNVYATPGAPCEQPGQISDNDFKCIPRCDLYDRCLEGVIPAEVELIEAFDNWVFFKEPALKDSLGNRQNEDKLWRLDLTTMQSEILWESFDNHRLLGVWNGSTVVVNDRETENPGGGFGVTITNDVNTQTFELAKEMSNPDLWLEDGWLYSGGSTALENESAESAGIVRISLADLAEGTPELLLSNKEIMAAAASAISEFKMYDETMPAKITSVEGGTMWFGGMNFLCAYTLSTSESTNPPKCSSEDMPFLRVEQGSGGYSLLCPLLNTGSDVPVRAMDKNGATLNVVIRDTVDADGMVKGFIVHRGWAFYVNELKGITSVAMAAGGNEIGFGSKGILDAPNLTVTNFHKLVAMTNDIMLWVQPVLHANGTVIRSQVSSSRIPPPTCHEQLPCAMEGYICNEENFCVPGK